MTDERERGYRDDHGAALERAARLQEENERLRSELAAAKAPSPRGEGAKPEPPTSNRMAFVVLGAITAITAVVGAGIAIGARRAPVSSANRPFRTASAVRLANGGYVDVGRVVIPSDFTIEAWIKPASVDTWTGTERYIVAQDRRNELRGQCRLGIDGAGHLFFMMSDSRGDDHGLYATDTGYALRSRSPVVLHRWTHVAVTKAGRSFTLDVDGAEAASVMARDLFVHDAPDLGLRIGARMGPDGKEAEGTFDGAIDEVRIWRVPRSASEIRTWKNIPISTDRARLALHFPFNEGRGNTTRNTAGGLSGIFVGDVTWLAPAMREPWMRP